jgi:hypothetical protein
MVGAGRRLATDETVISASAVQAMYDGPATVVARAVAEAAGGPSAVESAVDTYITPGVFGSSARAAKIR